MLSLTISLDASEVDKITVTEICQNSGIAVSVYKKDKSSDNFFPIKSRHGSRRDYLLPLTRGRVSE